MNHDKKRVISPPCGAIVDDMLHQLSPDPVALGENCHHCKKEITSADDYTSDDDNIYCNENCYWSYQQTFSHCDYCTAENPELEVHGNKFCDAQCYMYWEEVVIPDGVECQSVADYRIDNTTEALRGYWVELGQEISWELTDSDKVKLSQQLDIEAELTRRNYFCIDNTTQALRWECARLINLLFDLSEGQTGYGEVLVQYEDVSEELFRRDELEIASFQLIENTSDALYKEFQRLYFIAYDAEFESYQFSRVIVQLEDVSIELNRRNYSVSTDDTRNTQELDEIPF